MILTCPNCATRYSADEAKFPPAGRQVRCAKCGHAWHQSALAPEVHEIAPEPQAAGQRRSPASTQSPRRRRSPRPSIPERVAEAIAQPVHPRAYATTHAPSTPGRGNAGVWAGARVSRWSRLAGPDCCGRADRLFCGELPPGDHAAMAAIGWRLQQPGHESECAGPGFRQSRLSPRKRRWPGGPGCNRAYCQQRQTRIAGAAKRAGDA